MSNEVILSYAHALVELSLTKKDKEEMLEASIKLKNILKNNLEIIKIYSFSGISTNETKNLIDKTFKNKLPTHLLNAIKLLKDKSQIQYLIPILDALNEILSKHLNIKIGIIYTTKKITSLQIKKIEEKLSKKLNKQIYLNQIIDNFLIGGFKIILDEKIWDYSIRNKVSDLFQEIIKTKI